MAIAPLKLVKCGDGSEPECEQISVPSTTIVGDLLVKTNGEAATAASAASVVSYFSQITGTQTVPGVTAGHGLLGKIRAGDTFEMNNYHAGASLSTVAAADLDAQSDYGITFVTVSSVAAWCIDKVNTTQKVVRVIENLDAASAQYPRCRVQFLPAAITFA